MPPCSRFVDSQRALLPGVTSQAHCLVGWVLYFPEACLPEGRGPEGLAVSPEERPYQERAVCTRGHPAAWHSFCSLFAAPELGCSQTKLSVCMECLEGVCHESVANRANQESWLVGEKTLTL